MIAPTDFMSTLAWSLLHFLWQGAAIAALAAAVMFVYRTPATRYLIGVGALALMLASFIATFSALSGAADASVTFTPARAPAAALASPEQDAIVPEVAMLAGTQAATSPDNFLWVARGWLAGVQARARARGDRLLPPDRAAADARAHGPFARAARGGDRTRARPHQAVRYRRQFLPGRRRDAVLLPSRRVVAQQAHPRGSRGLLR
jgi:hypothetical protein